MRCEPSSSIDCLSPAGKPKILSRCHACGMHVCTNCSSRLSIRERGAVLVKRICTLCEDSGAAQLVHPSTRAKCVETP